MGYWLTNILLLSILLLWILKPSLVDSVTTCRLNLPTSQYEALRMIYNSTGGSNWCIASGKWNFTGSINSPCTKSWKGIVCTCEYTSQGLSYYSIFELEMTGFCMQGRLPTQIGNLPSLSLLNVGYNHLSGTIPSSISKLTLLDSIFLENNAFVGTIPYDSVNVLSRVYTFNVMNNYLTGTIPNFTHSLGLNSIFMSNNSFTGTLPNLCHAHKTFEGLYADSNRLSSTIPSNIGCLTRLSTLTVYGNNLTGTIPSDIFYSTSMITIYVSFNQLTGSIPPNMTYMPLLHDLSLAGNHFTGKLPDILGNMTTIASFYLNDNFFSGTVPYGMLSIPEMQFFDIGNNLITGTLPPYHGDSSHLYAVYALNNYITGRFPTSLFNCELLSFVAINYNYFSGPFVFKQPQYTSKIFGINVLWLQSNYFSGTLPSSLGKLSTLTELLLNDNLFSGEIFRFFNATDSVSLQVVNVASNLFTGSIPASFLEIPSLNGLSAATNCLTGTIPETICNAKNLTIIDFDGFGSNENCKANTLLYSNIPPFIRGKFKALGLAGTIPYCMMNLPLLTALHLSGNNLVGTIPDIEANFLLNDLSLSNNLLTGSIPSGIQSKGFGTSLDLSNNKLDGVLLSTFAISPTQSTLKLAVNRLSGPLPPAILAIDNSSAYNVSTLDILASNIFECSVNEIPSKDEYSESYSCGSYELNLATYIWIGSVGSLIAIITLIVFCCIYFSKKSPVSAGESENIQIVHQKAKKWWTITKYNQYDDISSQISRNIESHASYEGKHDDGAVQSDVNDDSAKSRNISDSSSIELPSSDGNCLNDSSYVIDSQTVHRSIINPAAIVSSDLLHKPQSLLKNYKDFHETIMFLIYLKIFASFSVVIGVLLLVVFIPVYIGLNFTASIVSYDYGFIVSLAFLHGIPITVFVGVTVLIILLASHLFVYNLHPLMNQIMGDVTSPSNEIVTRLFFMKKYSLLGLLHLINVVVTLTVNASYVSTILSDSSISRSNFLVLQGCMALFKLTWNGFYVPWCSRTLSKYMSQPRSMQNRLMMSITNFIIAPCIATAVVNQSCFYYVFKASNEVSSDVSLTVCLFIDTCDGVFCCKGQTVISFSDIITPAFQYSYACGTALLMSYVPVLLYAYVAYGVLGVSLRLALAVWGESLPEMSLLSTVLTSSNMKGRDKVVVLLLHITVLLTFGISCPILGLCIVQAIVSDYAMSRLSVGQRLEYCASSRSSKLESLSQSVKSTVISAEYSNPYQILERDMRDSWRGLFSCFSIISFTVMAFWSLLFFDMIADHHGSLVGGCVSISYLSLIIIYFIVLKTKEYFKIVGTETALDSLLQKYFNILYEWYGISGGSIRNTQRDISSSIKVDRKMSVSQSFAVPRYHESEASQTMNPMTNILMNNKISRANINLDRNEDATL